MYLLLILDDFKSEFEGETAQEPNQRSGVDSVESGQAREVIPGMVTVKQEGCTRTKSTV